MTDRQSTTLETNKKLVIIDLFSLGLETMSIMRCSFIGGA